MMYHAYQATNDLLEPVRIGARAMLKLRDAMGEAAGGDWGRRVFALADLTANTRVTHHRPPFGIDAVMVGNRLVDVREEVALSLPFGTLLHFAKDDAPPQPKMLVVAPLSGHFATLLAQTVAVLSRDHDVYVTDWKNARDVPLSAGAFGFDDYVAYCMRFMEEIGPRAHMFAVCQPCVPALVAAALLAQDRSPAQPKSLTLMGGPVDTRISPTVVNALATQHSIHWFEANLISHVPFGHAGWGRRVYPGFLQLTAFMSMNMSRHFGQHRAYYQLLADGRDAEAKKIREFYDEYYAVLDLTAEFYLETVERVFQKAELAAGAMYWRGRKVDCGAITRTALLTVEGERDDICAVGQTAAAHDLCTSLRPHLRRHHLQPGVGHYGLFSGRRWEKEVYPQVKNLVLATA
ncbi:polyhydroxyalkanoate depolymerase [Sphingomonas zeicaulis]|uniref:polyhydroxyalkanoate depolymerase n=1 Tax=Sphingomonas zeicaulis TaxID=1632740 RepID=UPI003D1FB09E